MVIKCNKLFGTCGCGQTHDFGDPRLTTAEVLANMERLRAVTGGSMKERAEHKLEALVHEDLESPLTNKDTNPKDTQGAKKVPMSRVPVAPLMEVACALHEGNVKGYRGHNWRVAGVRGSIYYDAAMRHLMAWYEGQDLDPDSGVSHISKAIAGLFVLRDAMILDNWTDDRPPKTPEAFLAHIQELMDGVNERYPNPEDGPYTELNDGIK